MKAEYVMQGSGSNRYTLIFTPVVVGLFALALYWMMSPFWGALAWGVCLAFMLDPLQVRLTRRLWGSSSAAAGLITALVPIGLLVPLLSLGLAFVQQVMELSKRIKASPLRFDPGLLAQLEQAPLIGPMAGMLRLYLSATTEQLQGWLDRGIEMLVESLAGTGGNFLIDAMGTFIHFFMMLFLLFFLLRDGRSLLERLVRLVPLEAQHSARLLRLVGDTVRAVVFGEVLTAMLQGLLVGIGFAIAGLPSAVVFGVLAAALALLPVGGAAAVWVPAVIYMFYSKQAEWALFLLAWGAVVSVADNLMRPLLIARYAPISVLAVFVGVIGGLSAFGMIGVIIGPVMLNVIITLLRDFEATRTTST